MISEECAWIVWVRGVCEEYTREQYLWTEPVNNTAQKKEKSEEKVAKEHSGQRASINVGKNIERA